MTLLNKEQMDELLGYFRDFVGELNRKKTGKWKIKMRAEGISVLCDVPTSDYVDVPTCVGILALWNTRHPDLRLEMTENFCIEDEDRYTTACWKMIWL